MGQLFWLRSASVVRFGVFVCVCARVCVRCAMLVINRIQENVCCGGRVVSIIATQQEGHLK